MEHFHASFGEVMKLTILKLTISGIVGGASQGVAELAAMTRFRSLQC